MRDTPARPHRFYVAEALREATRIALAEDAAHHAARVLRLRLGDTVTLFDGRGGEYAGTIAQIGREGVLVEVGVHRAIERESPLAVTLVQGVSSNERMDATLQKSVELGVAAIQPVLAEKSVVRLSEDRARARLAHWRRIVVAACEQSGRNRLPELRPAVALAEYCRHPDQASLRLVLSPRARLGLREAAARTERSAAIAVGPEAGFGAAEEAMLVAAGFAPVRLGPRVLRTETAAPAALSALNALAGDF